MLTLKFHPDVTKEIKASYEWYQDKALGLGSDFINELESGFEAIISLHDTWPIFSKGFRRYILPRFPFSVIYRKHDNSIYIVAVMHNSRKPGYWLSRKG